MTEQPQAAPAPVSPAGKHIDIEAGLKTLAGAAGIIGTFVTVAIGFNTYVSGRTQVQVASQQRCIDLSTAYMAMIRSANAADNAGQPPSIQDANYKFLLFNHDLRQAVCKSAGFAEDLGLPSTAQLQQIAAPPADQPIAPPIAPAVSAPSPGPGPSVAAAPPPPRPVVSATASPLRVFVQIHDADQREAARALVQRLRAITVDGHPIIVPGIQLVGSATQNSVRCLKAADCVLNEKLAAAISAQLVGANLDTLNLSGRYDSAPNVKAGTYELWFGPGPIVLAPA